jgi:hypothetical protein
MPDKVLVLTASYGPETTIIGVFTTPAKLTAFLGKHPEPNLPGLPLAQYDMSLDFKVDAE